jgi:hypothetical protein
LTAFDDPSVKTLGQDIAKLPPGKTEIDVCRDFLQRALAWFLKEIHRRGVDVNNASFEFYITVPASWSDAARSATLEAVKQAGFRNFAGDRIYLITEPEAAALTALSSLTKQDSVVDTKVGEGSMLFAPLVANTELTSLQYSYWTVGVALLIVSHTSSEAPVLILSTMS